MREVLPSIRVPTLVMHRRDDTFIKVEHSRYIAEHIPGARYVELEGGRQHVLRRRHRGDLGRDRGVPHRRRATTREPDRMLATVMFTDIVRLHRARRRHGRPRLARSCSSATTRCSGGRSSATAAARSSAPATASSPPSTGRRARSAARRRSPTRWARSGLELRAGLHTGELEVMDDDLGGLAVHIAARVMDRADAERGARLEHREGPRGGLRNRLRGPRRRTSCGACRATGAFSG